MNDFDVIVVGAGAGGICAALASSRSGQKTLLIEKEAVIGGTGVHSPVSLICKFHGADHRPINMGIHREMFPHVYVHSTQDKRPEAPRLTYDEADLKKRYQTLLNAEPLLTILTDSIVESVVIENSKIESIKTNHGETFTAKVYVDSTADGNLSALAGCEFQKGRPQDGALQSATLVFAVGNIDKSKLKHPDFSTRGSLDSLWEELTPYYHKAQQEGRTQNPKKSVVAFPYPDGERLLFNSNELLGIDPTDPSSVAKGQELGDKLIDELFEILKEHPAFENCELLFKAKKLGVREGRRIVGDYILTEEDCLGEARFDDMVVACAYEIDIHDPDGNEARMTDIPGSGYYHIPYRCLIAKGMKNLLLGSRCISGTHEAHSSYRVISGVSAIGQAAGTAAALMAGLKISSTRDVDPKWIRYSLRKQVQFVEGVIESPPSN